MGALRRVNQRRLTPWIVRKYDGLLVRLAARGHDGLEVRRTLRSNRMAVQKTQRYDGLLVRRCTARRHDGLEVRRTEIQRSQV